MLSVRTTASWVMTIGLAGNGAPLEYYANPATANSAYDAMEALVAWANDGARAWAGVVTFSWSWTRSTDAAGGALLVLTATGGTMEIDNGALTLLKFANVAGVTSVTGEEGATGTWDPPLQLTLRRYARHLDTPGEASGVGVARVGVAGLAHRRPQVEAACYRKDVGRLVDVLAAAANPRLGWLYQETASTWRLLSLGEMRQSRVDPLVTRVALEVLG